MNIKYQILNEVLIEWNKSPKEDSDNVFLKSEDIKKSLENTYFIYEIKDNKKYIKIFSSENWPEFEKYRDKVWINGKHVELDNEGYTIDMFEPGEYKVYIKDIDKFTDITYMFFSCTQLVSVFIPDSATEISGSAFYNCTSLRNMTIGNSVTEIGKCAFRYCVSLTSVTIPNSVTEIGSSAFYSCVNLKSVYVEDINRFNQIEFKNKWSDPRCYGAKVIEIKK